jgi:hypothetical protein
MGLESRHDLSSLRFPRTARQAGGPGPVARVGPAVVVELQVPVQGGLQGPHVGEEPAAELHAPQLGEDGAMQALGGAVGPGVAGPGAGMLDTPGGTGLVEGAPVPAAAVGEHPGGASLRPGRPGASAW